MDPFNIALIFLSSLSHSLWNILTQTSKNSRYFSGLKGLWIIVLAAVFFTFSDASYYHPQILFWGVVSGVLHGFYILCLSRAYSNQDISYVYPIARSAPVFVPVFAFFLLGERLDPLTWVAIIAILAAIYTLHFDGHLISGFKKLYDAILHHDLRWAFYTLAMVVSYSLVDKKGMEVFFSHYPDQAFTNGIIFFFLEAVVGFTLYLAYLFWVNPRQDIISTWKGEWGRGLISGVATLVSYGLICVVLQFESVSAVVSLRQISVLMVVYWGCWKLGEPFGRQRLLAGAMIVAGIVLIAINGPR